MQAETLELAQSLALWTENGPWWGDIGWLAPHRSCDQAILGRYDDALQLLVRLKESPRLRLQMAASGRSRNKSP